jgi:hypothetical protein
MDDEAAEDLIAALDAASLLHDLSPLKSVGLHKLGGDRKEQWVMTINGPGDFAFVSKAATPGKLKLSIITEEMALRLARYFDNSARFWLNSQAAFELPEAEAALEHIPEKLETFRKRICILNKGLEHFHVSRKHENALGKKIAAEVTPSAA